MITPLDKPSDISPIKVSLSLKTVAERVICHFHVSSSSFFDINEVASALKVPKRRLYDVLNIMGPLGLVNRHGRGKYQWTGVIQPALNIPIKKEEPSEKSHVRDLSLKFLYFIKDYQSNIISIETISESVFEEKKGQLRRLYDISAVFEVLNLIKRQPKTGDFLVQTLLRQIFITKMLPPKKRGNLTPMALNRMENLPGNTLKPILVPSFTSNPNGKQWLGAAGLH